MKKYLQISIVLGVFALFVWLRQSQNGNSNTAIGSSANATGSSQGTQTIGSSSVHYKDGTYTGSVADAYYGNIQVQVSVSGGKLTDVQFLQHPNDNPTSSFINSQAMPILRSEALQAQSATVQGVSGASDSSAAFQQSLASALQQAQ